MDGVGRLFNESLARNEQKLNPEPSGVKRAPKSLQLKSLKERSFYKSIISHNYEMYARPLCNFAPAQVAID